MVILALSGRTQSARARLLTGVKLALLAFTLGALFPTNAWDVPVYAALAVVAMFMGTAGLSALSTRLLVTAIAASAVGILAYALFLPFHAHYVALFGSIERTRTHSDLWAFLDHLGGLLTIVGFGLMICLWRRAARPGPFATLSIGPVAIILALLIAAAVSRERSTTYTAAIQFAFVLTVALLFIAALLPSDARKDNDRKLLAGGAFLTLIGTLAAVASDREVLGLMIALAGAGAGLWLVGDGPRVRFVGALVAAAALVAGGVEVVFLADDLATTPWYRMNTVFKFYNQVWVLLAIAAAALAASMVGRFEVGRLLGGPQESRVGLLARLPGIDVGPDPPEDALSNTGDDSTSGDGSISTWAAVGVAASGLVILASLAYPLLATRPRLEERFSGHPGVTTLNALDWMHYGTIPLGNGEELSFAGDLAAIEWLNENVAGSPVIAEASIGPYRCNGSRISINTGLPTIIGWDRHERQQRFPEGLSERVADVRELYASTDPVVKLALIRQYDVRFVVVGQLERVYPEISGNDCIPTNPTAGIAAFDAMIGSSLEVAFRSEETVVYRVLPPTG